MMLIFSFVLYILLCSFIDVPFIRYGCPSMEELETYSQEYKKKLDEVGAQGEIPDDLALEVKK